VAEISFARGGGRLASPGHSTRRVRISCLAHITRFKQRGGIMTRGDSAGVTSRHPFDVILVSSPARRRLRGLR
jgi:hypothetical protein